MCTEERPDPASTSNPTVPRPTAAGNLRVRARDTRTTEAISTQGNFSEDSSHPAQPPKDPGVPQSGLTTRRPARRAHATLPLTTDTDWLGSDRCPGHEQGAAEGPGP